MSKIEDKYTSKQTKLLKITNNTIKSPEFGALYNQIVMFHVKQFEKYNNFDELMTSGFKLGEASKNRKKYQPLYK